MKQNLILFLSLLLPLLSTLVTISFSSDSRRGRINPKTQNPIAHNPTSNHPAFKPSPSAAAVARVSATMKVHPAPKKRNITLRYDVAPANNLLLLRQKKLRRLPHIFAKVLELPFRADADVNIEETDEYFRFVVSDTDVARNVRADAVEICPGVTKIVVRSGEDLAGGVSVADEFSFELDLWRFRLPSSTRPQLAVARYADGDLVVTVPKGGADEEEEEDDTEVWGDGNLVLVQ